MFRLYLLKLRFELCMCMYPCRTIVMAKSIDHHLVKLFAVDFVFQSLSARYLTNRALALVFRLLCMAIQLTCQLMQILLNNKIERVLFSVHLTINCQYQYSFRANHRCCCSHRDRWLLIRQLSYCPNVQHN